MNGTKKAMFAFFAVAIMMLSAGAILCGNETAARGGGNEQQITEELPEYMSIIRE